MTAIRPPQLLPNPVPAATPTTVALTSAAPDLARLAAGTVLLGTVMSRAGGEGTLVATAEGPIRLPVLPALPPGTSLTLEIASTGPRIELSILSVRTPPPNPTTPGPASEAAAPKDFDDASLIHRWPALESANAALTGRLPIPRPGPELGRTMAQFILAVREGTIERWLERDTLRTIEAQTGAPLAARLREDFGALSARATLAEPRDWQLVVLPFLNGAVLQQAQLYLRRRGAGSEDGEAARRFFLQLAGSPYGWLQLDGLIGERRFDLVLRSEATLPAALRHDLTDLFTSVAERAGYVGCLDFAPGMRAPAPTLAHLLPDDRGMLV